MTAGAAVWAALIGLVGFLVFACVGDLVSEEVRGRLNRLPHALIALAARRVPAEVRGELREEWTAELHEILRGAEALPITRLVIGIRYAAGLLRTAHGIGRQLSPNHRRDRTGRSRVAALARGAAFGVRRIATLAANIALALALALAPGTAFVLAPALAPALALAFVLALVFAPASAIGGFANKRLMRDKDFQPDSQLDNAPPDDAA